MSPLYSTWHSSTLLRLAPALLVCALVVSGCSGSNGAQAPSGVDTSVADKVETTNTNVPSGADTENDVSVEEDGSTADDQDAASDAQTNDDSADVIEQPDGAGTADDTAQNGDGMTETDVNTPPNTDTPDSLTDDAQADPMSPVSTVVSFEITVPAYMSNELNLEVNWGDKALATQWVGDELWTASDTFPINAMLPLVISFTDNNGDIVLGVYEADFRTGINASEIVQISAGQFNTEQWDDDGDGVSNLNESVAGTNPLIIETEQLEIVDSYYGVNSLLAHVGKYEEKLTELPYFEQSEEISNLTWSDESVDYVSNSVLIDVDENGTGTFSDENTDRQPSANTTTIDNYASRTNTGESITYVVTWKWFNSSAAVGDEWGITSDTQALDANTRTQTAELYTWDYGTGNGYRNDTEYTLTGKILENTAGCEASYGVLTYVSKRVGVSDEPNLTTVSKGVDDQYWNVTITTPKGSVVKEYLAQRLGKGFYCDMQGL